MLVLYIYIALAGYNTGYLTLDMAMVECLVDEAGDIAVLDERGNIKKAGWQERRGNVEEKGRTGRTKGGYIPKKQGRSRNDRLDMTKVDLHDGTDEDGDEGKLLDWNTLWNEGTDAVMDVPIGGVCEVLYGQGRQTHNGA